MSDPNADPNAVPPAGQPASTPAPAYGEPAAPAYGGPAAPQQKTNVLAIISLITGILIPIVGIILGFIAKSQIKKTGEQGNGLATAGIVIGFVLIVVGIIVSILSFVALAQLDQGVITNY